MLSEVTKILTDGLYEGEKPLRGNTFAMRLAMFIQTNDQMPDMLRLLAILLTKKPSSTRPLVSPRTDRDRRIKSLFLQNVRQYCLPGVDERYYSIDFTVDGYTASSVIHGANGSGKTTVYASLEYIYLGRSDIAGSHGAYNDSLDFFRSVGISSDSGFEALLEGGERIESNRIPGFEVPAMFCSECDYFELSRNWNHKKQYIATQIGYGEVLTFLSMLRTLDTLFHLAYRYADNKKEIRNNETRMRSAKDPEEIRAIESRSYGLKIEQKNLNSRFLQEGGAVISNHISKFANKIKNYPAESDNYRDLKELIPFVEKCWDSLITTLAKVSVPIIRKIMEENLDKKSESIEIATEGDDLEVRLKIRSQNDDSAPETKTPAEYFNTFRLKLFCVAFKMALLCCAKIRHHINMPFVVDDIFDSCDFRNRKRIRGFIRRLFESHNEAIHTDHNPEMSTQKYPLQMLFFTQDNIIGENVYQGIKDFIEDSGFGCVKYGRLFRPCDMMTEPDGVLSPDSREYDMDGKKLKTINIEDPLKQHVRQ